MKKINKDKSECIIIGCNKTVRTRGVCSVHYHYINGLIKKGLITNEIAIEKKVLLPNKREAVSNLLVDKMLG